MKIKYYEDFIIGSCETFGHYVLEKDEVISYAKKWDPQPFHIDEAKAEKSVFKGLTASSSHIFAISINFITHRETKVKVIAMLGIESMQFKNPARPGDHLYMTHECIDKIESKSRYDRGIVKNQNTLKNQNNEIIITYLDSILVAKKSLF